MHLRSAVSLFLVIVAGCARPEPGSDAPTPGRSTPVEPTEPIGARPSPPSRVAVDQVRSLLLARHEADLPSPAVLARVDGAAAALRSLARDDDQVIVRARALMLLGTYPDAESEAVLREVLADASAPPKLAAAATRALASWDLQARDDLRSVVQDNLGSQHVVVAVAAARALRDVPAARSALQSALDRGQLQPAVAAEVRASLGHNP